MLFNFLTKALLAPLLTRESSFAMGYIYLVDISKDFYCRLVSRSPLSTLDYCLPQYVKKEKKKNTKKERKTEQL